MLRVGLTGDLGSGKSTVARMFAERGAVVLSSDEIARSMMQPGEAVYAAIVARFGASVVSADGTLDRHELARLAFNSSQPQVEELNAIVHPAVLHAQAAQIAKLAHAAPRAIVIVESALIFTTTHADKSWRARFDRILLVTAPEEHKIVRFVERMAAGRMISNEERSAFAADARRRLALQQPAAAYAADCLVVPNDGSFAELEQQVNLTWDKLQIENQTFSQLPNS